MDRKHDIADADALMTPAEGAAWCTRRGRAFTPGGLVARSRRGQLPAVKTSGGRHLFRIADLAALVADSE